MVVNLCFARPSTGRHRSAHDLAAKLFACVDALDAEVHDTVHLHYYQELTLQETADALGVATSTVKYRLRQALAQLQKKANEDFVLTKPRFNAKPA
ncbi:MAG: sigma factor-like helix-turn-helix DNA-binding protein [Verrucomicrobiota bacterium]